MSWSEVKSAINSNLSVPLNEAIDDKLNGIKQRLGISMPYDDSCLYIRGSVSIGSGAENRIHTIFDNKIQIYTGFIKSGGAVTTWIGNNQTMRHVGIIELREGDNTIYKQTGSQSSSVGPNGGSANIEETTDISLVKLVNIYTDGVLNDNRYFYISPITTHKILNGQSLDMRFEDVGNYMRIAKEGLSEFKERLTDISFDRQSTSIMNIDPNYPCVLNGLDIYSKDDMYLNSNPSSIGFPRTIDYEFVYKPLD